MPPPSNLRFTEVDAFTRSPGIEFHHSGEAYTPVAYLVGFNWLRDPKAATRVEVIKPTKRQPGEDPKIWQKIVEETKEAVAYHIKTKGTGKKVGGPVSVREIN